MVWKEGEEKGNEGVVEIARRKCTRMEDAREEVGEGKGDFPTKPINKKVGKVGGVTYTYRNVFYIYTIYGKGAEGKARGQQRLRRGRRQENDDDDDDDKRKDEKDEGQNDNDDDDDGKKRYARPSVPCRRCGERPGPLGVRRGCSRVP